MTQITRYQADDGQVFDTKEQCLEHECLQLLVKEVENEIDSYDFTPREVIAYLLKHYTITLKS